MNFKWWFFILSLLIIIPGLFSLIFFGLKLGIDFTGGTLFEYKFEKSIDQNLLKNDIQKFGEVSSVTLSGDNTYIIKTKPLDENKVSQARGTLEKDFGKVEEVRVESVGPVIGGETTKNAIIAILVASVAIVLYI